VELQGFAEGNRLSGGVKIQSFGSIPLPSRSARWYRQTQS
jgi:hypothetical protein